MERATMAMGMLWNLLTKMFTMNKKCLAFFQKKEIHNFHNLFIIGETESVASSGNFHVWGARCYTDLITADIDMIVASSLSAT